MSLINVSDLTFAYEGSYDYVFEHASFRMDTDWKLGLTGRNGRGKTTLLKLLMGEYEYGGSISSGVAFDYFPFAVRNASLEGWQLAEEIAPGHEFWQLCREIRLLELGEEALYRPFATLSQGEQTKLLLAALFMREGNFLLIDEPTNHLDARGRELVSAYLNKKKGFILVSHDRSFLDGCVDHILSINRADIELVQGNFSSWQRSKELRDRHEIDENERLRREIKRLEKTAREKAAWSDRAEKGKYGDGSVDRGFIGHKAAKMMGRAKAIEGRRKSAVEERRGLLKNIETGESLKLHALDYHSIRYALLKDVSIDYGNGAVCRGVSFEIERGDRIALKGRNGAGKSSILKLVCGMEIPHTGAVQLGSGLVVSRVSQDTSGLRGSLTDYAQAQGVDESLLKTILHKLDFSREQFELPIQSFSGGQKKKLLIAGSLCQRAHLYVWDEPLNFIDVLSRMQLEELILEFQPTLLFVEHDRAFCERVATKVVEL